MAIRNARPDDAPILAEAEREIAKVPGRLASQPHELRDDDFRAKILKLEKSDSGIFLVIEENGAIAGHAMLEPRELAVTAHVAAVTLAVHEGFQGRGFGKQLMIALIDFAKANSRIEKIELHVRSTNEKAIRLYESLGFSEQGRKPKHLKIGPSSYLDDVYMALWVGPLAP